MLGLPGILLFAATLPMRRIAVAELSPGFVTCGRAVLAAVPAALALVVLRRPLPGRFWSLAFRGSARWR